MLPYFHSWSMVVPPDIDAVVRQVGISSLGIMLVSVYASAWMCRALIAGDDETMSDEAIWETLPVQFYSFKLLILKHVVISALGYSLGKGKMVGQLTDNKQLVLKLENQCPTDIGVVSAAFFKHVKLNPGEALYLGASGLSIIIRVHITNYVSTINSLDDHSL
ncbi:putative mannose-6-phosphate isomerase [Tripterygium wilfordii]|uniref:Putative mannose-6-phosphate isomerase n=1 Tax=Tripterygium wilfordii TaxID=458696 RepID=A0A7J7C4P1_TRIWF|nr:putative mannose-6-phosphate isomerase [Tripterygium wilfordii]